MDKKFIEEQQKSLCKNWADNCWDHDRWVCLKQTERQDNDGTGLSIPPAASDHIVALVTRRGGRRDSNYCQL